MIDTVVILCHNCLSVYTFMRVTNGIPLYTQSAHPTTRYIGTDDATARLGITVSHPG